jgi:hypothetical protein
MHALSACVAPAAAHARVVCQSLPRSLQINGLLQKAPHQRLPMGRRGVASVREHAWFKGFAWEGLRGGQLKAPYVPKLRDADDMRFFADCADENPGSEYGTYTSVGNFADF